MDRGQIETWVQAYRQAWESNDPAEIGDLYAEDAEYRMRPYLPPVSGREAIIADWLDRRDEPGETEFDHQVVAVTEDVGFVQGRTTYAGDPPTVYSNLWVLRLDRDGRATEFTEWYMEHHADRGSD